jgi:hypothetical protein
MNPLLYLGLEVFAALLFIALCWLIYLRKTAALALIIQLTGLLICTVLWLVNQQMPALLVPILLGSTGLAVIINIIRHYSPNTTPK